MFLHRLANSLLKALMPLSAIRQAQAFGWDHEEQWLRDESWLADVEADHDVWEADELWSAHENFTGGTSPTGKATCCAPVNESTTIPPEVVPPAEGDMPASAVSFGGAFKSDEVLIEELVEDYRQFLRQCFGK